MFPGWQSISDIKNICGFIITSNVQSCFFNFVIVEPRSNYGDQTGPRIVASHDLSGQNALYPTFRERQVFVSHKDKTLPQTVITINV